MSYDESANQAFLEKKQELLQDDVDEAKCQCSVPLSMILTYIAYYLIPLVSVMFAGHLGMHQLAASNIANSWASISGLAIMVGLSGALETLCGQGYGAGTYRMLGIYLQASCIISVMFTVGISLLWWFSDIILTLLGQDPEIAESACLYLKYLIPGLFAYGILQNILRFLETQCVVLPLVVCSLVPLTLQVGITYYLVNWTSLAYRGAPLGASISLWISVIMLSLYVLKANKFEQTWNGFSSESFSHIFSNLKLALPAAAIICMDFWSSQVLVLLAGLMSNFEISVPLIAVCVSMEGICSKMVIYGFNAAASTRISNELGSEKAKRAKVANGIALQLAVMMAIFAVGHKVWARFFSDSPAIIHRFATMSYLLMMSILNDLLKGLLSGVAKGNGGQRAAVLVNLGTFYIIRMPAAYLLGFTLNLNAYGLWLGSLFGLMAQVIGLLLLTKPTKLNRIENPKDSNRDNVLV